MASKYEGMPEPKCGHLWSQYQECLALGRKWRAAQRRAGKLAPSTAAGTYAVKAIYAEDDGRLMRGCVARNLGREAAERRAEGLRRRYAADRYFEGYSPTLLRQVEDSVRVVREEFCDGPERATGLDLEWHGTPEDLVSAGASLARRRREGPPLLSGTRRRRR